ncbi:gamma-glutamyltransferase [Stappia sp. 22II-S9-Z10]|nr:gamma-glutamyltransferase [Stappia sp. 22II-S9-Z10]
MTGPSTEAEADALRAVLARNARVAGPAVVTSAHPGATAAGAAALARGGNAFDAVLAAAFMETVLLPMKCGLAGDLVALYRRAGGPVETIVSVGAGALGLAEARPERVGPLSVGVPGAPDGYARLAAMARQDLATLVAPAVRAAEEGVEWSALALGYLTEALPVLARYSPDNPYAPGGRVPQEGDVRRLPGLGAWLTRFAERGAALFDGPHGDRLAAFVAARGGVMARADFAQRPAVGAPAHRVALDGAVLHVTPAPTHGPALAEAVHRAVGEPLERLPEIVRAVKAAARSAGRGGTDGGTSCVTAADAEGNVAVVLHSNSFPQFASGLVLDDGLVLNNRPGRGFDLSAPADAPAAPRPGRVPPTTVHAFALERGGRLDAGATPGGVNQLPWNVQALAHLLAGDEPAEAITRPRWALDAADRLTAEPGAAAPGADPVAAMALRSVHQILTVTPGRPHEAAVDPRTGASALPVF